MDLKRLSKQWGIGHQSIGRRDHSGNEGSRRLCEI
jgi:hypothetical protein